MVGNGAIVLHRSVVGTGAIVAANAVVLYDVDVPPGALAVGVAGHDQAGPGPHRGDHPRRRDTYVDRGRSASAASCGGSTDVLALVVTVPGQRGRAGERRALGARRRGHRGAHARRAARRPRTTSSSCGPRSATTSTRHARRRGVPGPLALAHGRRSIPPSPRRWRAHAVPSWVDRDLVVVPAWQDVATPAGALRVDIDPGAAFGLGDHPTTVLSLRLLREVHVARGDRARRRLRQRRAVDRRRSPRRAVRRGDRHLAGGGRGDDGERPAQRRRGRDQRQHDAAGDDRRRVRHRAGQPPGPDRRRARRRPAPASPRPPARCRQRDPRRRPRPRRRGPGADARRRDGDRATAGRRCCCVTERRAGRAISLGVRDRRHGAGRVVASAPAAAAKRTACRADRRPRGERRARRRTHRRRRSCRPARR